jgi:uncharacterized LabA/DUF88 family protein
MLTAILVDGAFFLKRFPKIYMKHDPMDPTTVAKTMRKMACYHLNDNKGSQVHDLYRIFFYDCPPVMKKAQYPVSKKPVDFSKTPSAKFRLALHAEIKKLRKVALRLGQLSDYSEWKYRPETIESLRRGVLQFGDLRDDHFIYDAHQKGVDMRIGLDIAAIAYKKLANQIVLVAGDADFVPAAKLARREGIDFILDPMWNHTSESLLEHIDGLRSTSPNPNKPPIPQLSPPI